MDRPSEKLFETPIILLPFAFFWLVVVITSGVIWQNFMEFDPAIAGFYQAITPGFMEPDGAEAHIQSALIVVLITGVIGGTLYSIARTGPQSVLHKLKLAFLLSSAFAVRFFRTVVSKVADRIAQISSDLLVQYSTGIIFFIVPLTLILFESVLSGISSASEALVGSIDVNDASWAEHAGTYQSVAAAQPAEAPFSLKVVLGVLMAPFVIVYTAIMFIIVLTYSIFVISIIPAISVALTGFMVPPFFNLLPL